MPVRRLGDGTEVAQVAEHVRRLDHDAGHALVDRGDHVLGRGHVRRQRHDGVARHPRERPDHLGVVGMEAARQHGLAPPRDPMRHQHRFARAGGAVVHGGVRHLHAGQRRDLGLELEQVLERPLRDLRLVGRVARQELGALDEVVHARRNVVLVGAGADEEGHGGRGHVPRRHARENALDLHLSFRARQVEEIGEARVRRDVGEQLVDAADPDPGQHLAAVGVGQGEVAHRSLRREPGAPSPRPRSGPSSR